MIGSTATACASLDARPPQTGVGTPSDAAAIAWQALPRRARRDGDLGAVFAAREPCVLTDLAAHWPALERWNAETLAARFGDRPVRVYDARFGEPGPHYMGSIDTMAFGDFLEQTLGAGRDLRMFLYNLAWQIPELVDDIVVPEGWSDASRRFVFSFFGCRGSTTPLHYDIDMGDVLHTVISGRRRIRLFPPDDARRLYQHPFTVRSYVDLDTPDFARFPALASARGREVVLEAGESLFMPAGWWHEFHYLEAGMGVSLRRASPRFSERMKGALTLALLSPVDRLGNRLAAQRWHDWKLRRADARAPEARA